MSVQPFLHACAAGDVAALETQLAADPTLVSARDAGGRTGLHLAVRHPDAVRRLLAHGADANARERGDNVTPLHLAAANGVLESVALLLEAGADVHGAGDAHEGGVIGWAVGSSDRGVIDLLLARGARHHVFSAMALRDRDLVRRLVAEDPAALQRRRSRFENRHTAVHAAIAAPDGVGFLAGAPDHDMLALLIELGADVNETDDRGRTPLDLALLRGDREAMRLLQRGGARAVPGDARDDVAGALVALAGTVTGGEPMFSVRDARATIDWYQAIGFSVLDAYEEDGAVRFARLGYGACRFALSPDGASPAHVSLWVLTSAVAEVYALVKSRQLSAARAALAGDTTGPQWPFDEDLYVPFYGGRQFSVRDPNGLSLVFYQPGQAES
jgi:ankyrin repeat protein